MVALDAQGEVEAQLGALKEKQAKMVEQVKDALGREIVPRQA